MPARVAAVEENSIADKAGVKPGDELLEINGHSLRDILDYHYYCDEADLFLDVKRENSTRQVRVSKNPEEHLGLHFDTSLFDGMRRCRNECIFCFVDQLPSGVRESLKVKDDDYRLSFLYGNFITLTNLTKSDVERIIEQRLSPLYLSLHAIDPDLHRRMVRPVGEDKGLDYFKELLDAGIDMHVQIVLCPGYNDGEALERTLSALAEEEGVLSVGIVPVGLTSHRAGLEPLRAFERSEVEALVEKVSAFQKQQLDAGEDPWIYLADEFYAKFELELPPAESYADFPQLENGIGIARLFLDDVEMALDEEIPRLDGEYDLVTGLLASTFIEEAAKRVSDATGLKFEVVSVENRFLGSGVTVAGLLVGADIAEVLKEKGAKHALIPDIMLNADGVFIDDLSSSDVARLSGAEISIVPTGGADFVDWLIGNGV